MSQFVDLTASDDEQERNQQRSNRGRRLRKLTDADLDESYIRSEEKYGTEPRGDVSDMDEPDSPRTRASSPDISNESQERDRIRAFDNDRQSMEVEPYSSSPDQSERDVEPSQGASSDYESEPEQKERSSSSSSNSRAERGDQYESVSAEEGAQEEFEDWLGKKRDEGKFNLCAKRILLTYPKADGVSKQEIARHIRRIGGQFDGIVCEEKHVDGTIHFHVLAGFPKEKSIKNARYFDYKSVDQRKILHPNIRAVARGEKNWKACYFYCIKDQNYIEIGVPVKKLYANPENFIRARQNEVAWRRFRRGINKEEVKWPVKLTIFNPNNPNALGPNVKWEIYLNKPTREDRKFNHIIIGGHNIGKSYNIKQLLSPYKTYLRAPGRDTIWESYDEDSGADFMIIDTNCGVQPSQGELETLTDETVLDNEQIPGRNRGAPKYLRKGELRCVIWIANDKPDYIDQGWFQSRFWVHYAPGTQASDYKTWTEAHTTEKQNVQWQNWGQ